MTAHILIGDISPRLQATGDGAQVTFTFPFPIFKDADLAVYVDDVAVTSGLTISGAGQSDGGDVTFDTPPANGSTVTILRRLTIARSTDFQEGDDLSARSLNDEFDYLTAALQELAEDQTRTLRLSETDTGGTLVLPSQQDRALMHLGFDADGNLIATDAKGPQGPQGPSGDMTGANNLSELTDPAAARSNLGLGTAAVLTAGTGAGNLVQLDGSGALPAVDGSALTGVNTTELITRTNIALLGFRVAAQHGLSVQNMVDGVIDEFEDETGIDAGNSSGQTYDATSDYYHNPSSQSMVLSGGSATATRTDYGSPADLVDGSTADTSEWGVTQASLPQIWYYDRGAGNEVKPDRVRIWGYNAGGGYGDLNAFDVVGSNDGTNWTTLHSGNAPASASWGDESFAAPGTAYRYLGIRCKTSHEAATALVVNEVEIYATSPAADLTLQSAAMTAAAQPDTALVVLFEEDVDAVTLGTDLKAFASRDGGTTWTEISLSDLGDYESGKRVLSGTADISAQPAGTGMKWKITTHNNKELRLHGVALEWR